MTDLLILGAPVAALTPGLVELSKRAGLPTRWAGAAAIAWATMLVMLADVAGLNGAAAGPPDARRAAGWVLAGVVYGLAAAGLYSQARRLGGAPPGE